MPEQATAPIATTQDQFMTAIESLPDGVFVYDSKGAVLHTNAAGRAMFGYDVAMPEPGFTQLPPEARAQRYRLRDVNGHELTQAQYPLTRILHGETLSGNPNDDLTLNTLTDKEITISISGKPTYAVDGALTGAIIVFRDITTQKLAERTLRENEQRLQHFFQQAPVGIFSTTLTGQFLSFNQQFCDIVGYTSAEMAHLCMSDLSHPANGAHTVTGMQQLISGVTSRILLEKRYRHKDGHDVWVLVNSTLIREEHGTPVSFLSIVEDLTARRAQEAQQRAIAEAEMRLVLVQQMMDQLPNAAYLVRGHDARLVLANAATHAVWGGHWEPGVPLPDFSATTGTRMCWPDGRTQITEELAAIQVARTGVAVQQRQQVIRHADGTQLPILINAVPFDGTLLGWRDAAGQPERGALVTLQDVTALQEAERLKDEFLALAAHELRTPIGVVSGYAQLLEMLVPDVAANAEQRGILTSIQLAARRLAQLANDLLDVTRLEAGHLTMHAEPFDLAALAQRVVAQVQVTTQDHDIRLHAPQEVLWALGDATRVEQVITNLLTNAVKYSPDGGVVRVRLHGGTRQGQALLAVRDRGIGIPMTEQGRIFGRFARAENARARGILGTGLGLYLCRELMERQGGRIWFTSVPGRGTIFFIALPLATVTATHKAAGVGASIR